MSIPDFKFVGEPLTVENMKVITGFIVNSDDEVPHQEDGVFQEDKTLQFYSGMVQKRIEAYGLKFQLTNFYLLSSILTFAKSPGLIMIGLWQAHQYSKRTGKSLLGIADWCHIYPMGTPTEEECNTFWDSQKADGEPLGNMLDNVKYWQL